jgi:hypothetical protein
MAKAIHHQRMEDAMKNEFIVGIAVIILILQFFHIWIQRQWMKKQRNAYGKFKGALLKFCARGDVPPSVQKFLEALVLMPTNGDFVRRSVLFANDERSERIEQSVEALFKTVHNLGEDAEMEFNDILSTYFMVQFFSSIVFGVLFYSAIRTKGSRARITADSFYAAGDSMALSGSRCVTV